MDTGAAWHFAAGFMTPHYGVEAGFNETRSQVDDDELPVNAIGGSLVYRY